MTNFTKYFAVVLCCLLAPAVHAQAETVPPSQPHLTAQGHAEIKVPADVAYLILTVKVSAKREAVAAQENAARTAALVAQIKTIPGIKSADIETMDYSAGREFKNAETSPIFVGYEVTNSVQVTLHAVSRASRLVDLATTSGATRVTGLNYGLLDRQAAERRALTLAVVDARGRAQTIAAAAGKTLGTLRLVSDSSAYESPVVYSTAGAESFNGAYGATPISPQIITIRADASVDYALAPE